MRLRFSHLKLSQNGNRMTPCLWQRQSNEIYTLVSKEGRRPFESILMCETFRLRAMLILAILMIDGCKRIQAECRMSKSQRVARTQEFVDVHRDLKHFTLWRGSSTSPLKETCKVEGEQFAYDREAIKISWIIQSPPSRSATCTEQKPCTTTETRASGFGVDSLP